MSIDHEQRTGSELVAAEPDPVPDPGMEEHLPRPTDVDPIAERRAERQVATLFGLSVLFTLGFCVAYFAIKIKGRTDPPHIFGWGASNVALGGCLGIALLLIGTGAILWARKLMGDHEIMEMRHPARSSDEDREEALSALSLGTEESGIARRPLIRNSMLAAMGALGLPAIVALRDLGPLPGKKLFHTVWTEDMPIVQDVTGTKIKASDMQVGQLVNAEPGVFYDAFTPPGGGTTVEVPEGVTAQEDRAKAAIVVVRMDPDAITPAKGRADWGVNGILVFSKICTHVGCPISLWEQQTHHLLCPCHQSTFDLADNGKVIFGPAGHALPQLPIKVDEDGYLVAQSDFTEPVGPSFWERG
ncbi:Rieske (2Fe-2S) protein [Nocardioides mangrovicus]|uniref:Cytochrome bc1 complex Rieske iron-sulfur subunit n=1 Tax=Nocardioides mangrovicus TaxID=2478913 RepID=A0A3L8P112_9ACTN|nr:Rieske 2Fe-2S domain-containing protein [Nocardioides mangrovicus]RLV49136.1 Rieske (2Fe-2S) protein [Nocardioides mangrovicus]